MDRRFIVVPLLAVGAILLAPPAAGQEGGQGAGGAGQGGDQASSGGMQPTASPKGLTGDWGGFRERLADDGVTVDIRVKAEAGANLAGGTSSDLTVPAEVRVGTTVDTAKLLGWQGGTFRVSVTRRFGPSLEDRAGLDLLMQPQEVFGTGTVLRLSEVSLQQSFAEERFVIKAGRMSPSEFATFDCDFMNLGLCGAPPGNTVTRYWFVAPAVSWHGWAKLRAGAAYLKLGVTEDNRNNLLDRGFYLSRRGARGVLTHAEVGWTPVFGGGARPGRYQVGGWVNSSSDDDVLLGTDRRPRVPGGASALRRDGQYGFYAQGQQQVTGRATQDPITGRITRNSGLNLFFNYLLNDRRTETIVTQANAGVFLNAPFASRPLDGVGLGIVRTRYNPRAARAAIVADPLSERRRAEVGVEAHYNWCLTTGVLIKPNVQLVFDPGGQRSDRNVVVLGLRMDLDL